MSRSYKKTPIRGHTTYYSEKADKKEWHGRMRARNRDAIHHEEEVMPEVREVSDVWGFAKDGKSYLPEECDKWFKEHEKPHKNIDRRKKFTKRRKAQQGKS